MRTCEEAIARAYIRACPACNKELRFLKQEGLFIYLLQCDDKECIVDIIRVLVKKK